MDFFGSLIKEILLIPLYALLSVPFLWLSIKIIVKKKFTFKALFLLLIINNIALIVVWMSIGWLFSDLSRLAHIAASCVTLLLVPTLVCGYFVTNHQDQSVGFYKGGAIAILYHVVTLLFFLFVGLMFIGLGSLYRF